MYKQMADKEVINGHLGLTSAFGGSFDLPAPTKQVDTPTRGNSMRNKKNNAIEGHPGDLESGHLSFEMDIRNLVLK